MIKDCEELSEIQTPLNTDDEIPLVAAQKRRRGKAIDWRFVKKFPTLDEARAEFSRGNLIGNEQFLGRKYTGKTSAIYINCQKITCGCNKKWRLVSSQSHPEVTLEETVEDHSNHEFFLRGGGNGLNSSQIKVTQEALLMNSRMRPLQIIHYFRDRAVRNSATGNRTAHYEIAHFVLPGGSLNISWFTFDNENILESYNLLSNFRFSLKSQTQFYHFRR